MSERTNKAKREFIEFLKQGGKCNSILEATKMFEVSDATIRRWLRKDLPQLGLSDSVTVLHRDGPKRNSTQFLLQKKKFFNMLEDTNGTFDYKMLEKELNIYHSTLYTWRKEWRESKQTKQHNTPETAIKRLPSKNIDTTIDLGKAIDQWTNILEKARNYDALESENNRLRNQKASLENELKILREDLQNRTDRELRFKLAQQQGDK